MPIKNQRKKRKKFNVIKHFKKALNQSYTHNLQLVKYLPKESKFNEEVRKIRDFAGIPDHGFMTAANKPDAKAVAKWRKEHRLSESPWRYMDPTEDSDFVILPLNEADIFSENKYSQLKASNFFNEWYQRHDTLLYNYQIPINFRRFLERYTLYNEIDAPKTNYAIEIMRTSSGNIVTEVHIYGYITATTWKTIMEAVNRY